MTDSVPTFNDVLKFLSENDLEVPKARNRTRNTPTSFYVRILAPPQYAIVLNNPKQLTRKIVKFGMTDGVSSRDCGYQYDNGYMAFTFECESRSEASIVERIMKAEYADLTVLDSLEYVDAYGLAERLGHKYDESSYDSYVLLARKLFVHMVETAKLVFPTKYLAKYGLIHKLKEGTKTLTGAGETISLDMAIQFGFRTPTTTWSQLSHDVHEEGVAPVERQVPEQVSSVEVAARAFRKYKDLYGLPIGADMRLFYDKLVAPKNSATIFERAKRYSLLRGGTMVTDINLDKNKFNATLFHGQRILESLLSGEAFQEVKCFGQVQVQEEDVARVMDEQFVTMLPEKKAKFYKLFGIVNDEATPFALFKRVIEAAFGMSVGRGSTSSKRKAYTVLTISNPFMTSIQDAFKPDFSSANM